MIVAKEKKLPVFKRFVAPLLSIVGSFVMIYASIKSHGVDNLWFLLIFAIIVIIGLLLPNGKKARKVTQ